MLIVGVFNIVFFADFRRDHDRKVFSPWKSFGLQFPGPARVSWRLEAPRGCPGFPELEEGRLGEEREAQPDPRFCLACQNLSGGEEGGFAPTYVKDIGGDARFEVHCDKRGPRCRIRSELG